MTVYEPDMFGMGPCKVNCIIVLYNTIKVMKLFKMEVGEVCTGGNMSMDIQEENRQD